MNEKALMKHISRELHTYVRKFRKDHTLEDEFCGREDLKTWPLGQNHLFLTLFERIPVTGDFLPVILGVNDFVSYTIVCIPSGFFLIGPIRFSSNTVLLHQITIDDFPLNLSDILTFPEHSVFANNIILLHNLYHESQITAHMLWNENTPDSSDSIQRGFVSSVFEQTEEGLTHNPYEQELREQSSIEQGNLEALKRSIAEDYSGSLGVLAADPVRNIKNIGIVVITLASRSAIRGGMLPEAAFSLSDSYIQQLEEMQDIPSIEQLIREAEFQYTEMVHEIIERKKGLAKKKNPYIQLCKNYIFSHLHDKITVQGLARELNINANYLSGLFKEHEGVSLSRYILDEKVNRAKNLLIYSEYSYIEIASYLCFSSQSHFIIQFKKVTGYTPKEYRDEFGKKEF